jgi:hypothetical protein
VDDHPILKQPWTYEVVEFHFVAATEDTESFLDLSLRRGSELRRLRFFSPQDISLASGFPSCPGLFISDVSSAQMENIRVQVGDYEVGPGGMSFWARHVTELQANEI